VAGFLTRALGGPFDPATAADLAAATAAERIPEAEAGFGTVEELPGGLRTLAQVALPGATRSPHVDRDAAAIAGIPTAEP
jgi:hypothetical protein